MMSAKGKPTPKKGIGKIKDRSKSSSSKQKVEVPDPSKDTVLTYPLIKTSENERILPRYSTILRRTEEQGVGMDDLDTIQLELEALLSAVALRTRALNEEIQALSVAEGKPDKKVKVSPLVPGKRLKSQERIVKKFKDTGGKVIGESFSAAASKSGKVQTIPSTIVEEIEEVEPEITEVLPTKAPKVVALNDTPNKFWSFVEPYCSEVTPEDIRLLESLIEENNINPDFYEIPPLGCHYTIRWADDDSLEEKPLKNEFLNKKIEKDSDVVAGPLTQRLISALMEESYHPVDILCKGDENHLPQLFKSFTVNNSANFERQVRKELEEQGILDLDEITKDEENDEILQELKRCQEELQLTSAQNVQQLNRLLKLANEEIARQDLKQKLQKVDTEIMKLAKKKKEGFSKKDQELCWKILKDRDVLLRLIDSM